MPLGRREERGFLGRAVPVVGLPVLVEERSLRHWGDREEDSPPGHLLLSESQLIALAGAARVV